jgi:hypothetical protein
LDATCGYPLAHYVENLASNIDMNKDNTNVELNTLRLSIYKGILNVLQQDALSVEKLQEQIAEWKSIRKIEDISKLINDVDTSTLTKDDLKNVKRAIKELDEVVTAIVDGMNKVINKCAILANKHEKVVENHTDGAIKKTEE